MAIWRASKPVIAQVHGWCVGGASDYALCADIVIASDDAVIGTPYARMWGAYLTGMWLYRLSLAKVKWHSLTGEPLTGKEAAAVELINESVPFDRLEARVAEVAAKLASIPHLCWGPRKGRSALSFLLLVSWSPRLGAVGPWSGVKVERPQRSEDERP